MKSWKFYDFLDSRGNNLIREWLDSLPEKASAKIDTRIAMMSAVRSDGGVWPEQYVSALVGWPEIFELRIVSAGAQDRPICFYCPSPGAITLGYRAIEKGT